MSINQIFCEILVLDHKILFRRTIMYKLFTWYWNICHLYIITTFFKLYHWQTTSCNKIIKTSCPISHWVNWYLFWFMCIIYYVLICVAADFSVKLAHAECWWNIRELIWAKPTITIKGCIWIAYFINSCY